MINEARYMTKITLPTHQALEKELKSAQLAISPAELHGLLTGMLSGGLVLTNTNWQSLLYDYTNDGMGWPMSALSLAENTLKATGEELASSDFTLALILAEDGADLFELAEGLSDWVNHFISGLGLIDAQLKQAGTDVKEALGDLEEIAKLGIDEDDDMAEQAILFEQVIEHVKTCVMTIHLELSAKPKADPKPTIH